MNLTESPDGKDVHFFEGAQSLDAWLEANHDQEDAVWIQMAKKGNPVSSVNWAEAVPVLLSHGWIDGQSRRVDDDWFLQRVSPRRPRSNWSQINVQHAERLIAEGKMRPWGLAEVERAKADGRWEAAYPPVSSKEIPEELALELDADPDTKAAFEALDSRNRYAIVVRVQAGKRKETRQRNAAKFVEMLRKGEKLH